MDSHQWEIPKVPIYPLTSAQPKHATLMQEGKDKVIHKFTCLVSINPKEWDIQLFLCAVTP